VIIDLEDVAAIITAAAVVMAEIAVVSLEEASSKAGLATTVAAMVAAIITGVATAVVATVALMAAVPAAKMIKTPHKE